MWFERCFSILLASNILVISGCQKDQVACVDVAEFKKKHFDSAMSRKQDYLISSNAKVENYDCKMQSGTISSSTDFFCKILFKDNGKSRSIDFTGNMKNCVVGEIFYTSDLDYQRDLNK